MPLTIIHDRLATSVLLYFAALMLWAFWRFFRKEGMNSSFWGAIVISEILILLQGALGIILWISSLRPAHGGMHVLYGVVGVLGVPVIFSITKGKENRYEMLLYAAGYLCLAALAFRSMATG